MLTGEHLAIDLVNTRSSTPDGEHDVLASAQEFEGWLAAESDRLVPPKAPLTMPELAAVRELRRHIETAIDDVRHGRNVSAGVLEAINDAAQRAPSFVQLTLKDGKPTAGTARAGNELDKIVAQLAEAAVSLLADPKAGTIRTCEGPGCRMIFLPAHPRRRWCSPELCGNRVRVARYYQRHKG
ncbi:CGNR zinc finger domain-containing protein [Phytoactinopolyspora halotolerans]|uniref:Zinc finger CGNR domain-containing protein n=1 Tax=Phytoactinopolyspora halotolerans TaxID=1981512 RepID=A0A6L9S3H0_9ACTN|nr:ABATE domain-containing protein [Phytoactinopolyspora halotolerans]NED99193.1 hypothetical protein [Phytoactinopolyspora halotolerans]